MPQQQGFYFRHAVVPLHSMAVTFRVALQVLLHSCQPPMLHHDSKCVSRHRYSPLWRVDQPLNAVNPYPVGHYWCDKAAGLGLVKGLGGKRPRPFWYDNDLIIIGCLFASRYSTKMEIGKREDE